MAEKYKVSPQGQLTLPATNRTPWGIRFGGQARATELVDSQLNSTLLVIPEGADFELIEAAIPSSQLKERAASKIKRAPRFDGMVERPKEAKLKHRLFYLVNVGVSGQFHLQATTLEKWGLDKAGVAEIANFDNALLAYPEGVDPNIDELLPVDFLKSATWNKELASIAPFMALGYSDWCKEIGKKLRQNGITIDEAISNLQPTLENSVLGRAIGETALYEALKTRVR